MTSRCDVIAPFDVFTSRVSGKGNISGTSVYVSVCTLQDEPLDLPHRLAGRATQGCFHLGRNIDKDVLRWEGISMLGNFHPVL